MKEVKKINDLRNDMKEVKKINDLYEPSTDDIIDLIHRMTGYSKDVLMEYVKVTKIKNLGKLTIDDIVKNMETIFFIERGFKIKKLINKINDSRTI